MLYQVYNDLRVNSEFGQTSVEIIQDCERASETPLQNLACFMDVVEKATAIREMIGADRMEDRCYAAISSKETSDRIVEILNRAEKQFFDKRNPLKTDIPFPKFEGCIEKDRRANLERQREQEIAQREMEQCKHLVEVDRAFAEAEASGKLRSFVNLYSKHPFSYKLEMLTESGLSSKATEAFIDNDEIGSAENTFEALIYNHHPNMLNLWVQSPGMRDGMKFLFENTYDRYRKKCILTGQ